MLIGTAVTNSHLARAKVLAQSVKLHHPEAKFVVSLVERALDPDIPEFPCFDEVVLAKDTWSGNFDQLIFKYDTWEACCFAKAPLLDYVMNKYKDEDQVLFLDSDMEVLAPLYDLDHRFKQSSVILTPQHIYRGSEYDDFKYGVFNAGFVGVSRNEEGLSFIKWWLKRLERHAYFGDNDTLFAEQKWLNLVPSFFDHTEIIRHPGYNVAGWNFGERKITRSDSGQYLSNGEPLYILHHHSISELEKQIEDESFRGEHPVLSELIQSYAAKLDRVGRRNTGLIPWSYRFFTSGEMILRESRLVYRNNLYLEQKYPNPFLLSNAFFANYPHEEHDDDEAALRTAPRKRRPVRRAKRKARRSKKRISKQRLRKVKRPVKKSRSHAPHKPVNNFLTKPTLFIPQQQRVRQAHPQILIRLNLNLSLRLALNIQINGRARRSRTVKLAAKGGFQ
ncbi:hypothetical protein [Paenibacillus protaetiae]|uniref:Glycosyl transferase n=1 Tax=Paenibacillus protaetiae TaxID=2509456 RepID=A0A4P6EVZ8_9BACL|nr:hypothetical protein [Paenibacillus protaetiae]QAY66846.1 hypothetical protein ET464_11030 [Paenibacillus protaetiae]